MDLQRETMWAEWLKIVGTGWKAMENVNFTATWELIDTIADEHHIHAGTMIDLETQMQAEQAVAPLLERAQELRTALNAL